LKTSSGQAGIGDKKNNQKNKNETHKTIDINRDYYFVLYQRFYTSRYSVYG